MWELALPIAAAGSGAAWARLAATRAPGRLGFGSTAFALLGGLAASGLALAAYDLAARAGVPVHWEALAAGGWRALLVATAIGLVEEGAKLTGILLVVARGAPRESVLASSIGVAGGFAALEALLVLHGEASAEALARAALAPVAHGLLAVPLAAGVAASVTRSARRWVPLAPALLAASALHGAGDLGLALPRFGRLVYAAALAIPAVVLFLRARSRAAHK